MASTVYNVMRGKGAPMLKPADFIPSFERRRPSAEELAHKIDAWAETQNAKARSRVPPLA